MKTTPVAAALICPMSTLPTLLKSYDDEKLEAVEAWAQAIVDGRRVRVTHHTPRGWSLSKEHGRKVLDMVRAEQTARCSI